MKTLVIAGLLLGFPLAADSGNVSDQSGKRKVVRQTPFGPVIQEVVEGAQKKQGRRELADDPNLKIEQDGDQITFRRRTPFGEQVWRRQRAELSEVEKELLAARRKTLDKEAAGNNDAADKKDNR